MLSQHLPQGRRKNHKKTLVRINGSRPKFQLETCWLQVSELQPEPASLAWRSKIREKLLVVSHEVNFFCTQCLVTLFLHSKSGSGSNFTVPINQRHKRTTESNSTLTSRDKPWQKAYSSLQHTEKNKQRTISDKTVQNFTRHSHRVRSYDNMPTPTEQQGLTLMPLVNK